jgi:hypothetical protein
LWSQIDVSEAKDGELTRNIIDNFLELKVEWRGNGYLTCALEAGSKSILRYKTVTDALQKGCGMPQNQKANSKFVLD